MRTFIALDLDPEIKTALSDLLRRLRWRGPKASAGPGNPGCTSPSNSSARSTKAQAVRVEETMKAAAAAVPAFALRFRGTGAFPAPPRSPRVLWVGTDEPAADLDLQARLEAGLEPLGFDPRIAAVPSPPDARPGEKRGGPPRRRWPSSSGSGTRSSGK